MQNLTLNPTVATTGPYLVAFGSYGQKCILKVIAENTNRKNDLLNQTRRQVQPGIWCSSDVFAFSSVLITLYQSLSLSPSSKHTHTHTHTHTLTHTHKHTPTNTKSSHNNIPNCSSQELPKRLYDFGAASERGSAPAHNS